MANEMNKTDARHKVVLEERCRLSVSGVIDVAAFDDESITADTDMGMIVIRGEDLHMEGSVDSIDYSDGAENSKGGFLLGKIFK